MQTSRQLFAPSESPYEPNVGGQLPNQQYPSDADFPVETDEPGFRLGTLHLEVPGVQGIFLVAEVMYRNPLRDYDAQLSIVTGDLQEVDATMPDFFWEPTEFYPVRTTVGDNRLLTAQYRDFAQKHPALKRPYKVTLILEYVEKHPLVEALSDANLRDRIYADLLNSDYSVVPIDVAKYEADPTYSAVAEIRQRYAQFFKNGDEAWHPTVESLKIQQLTAKP